MMQFIIIQSVVCIRPGLDYLGPHSCSAPSSFTFSFTPFLTVYLQALSQSIKCTQISVSSSASKETNLKQLCKYRSTEIPQSEHLVCTLLESHRVYSGVQKNEDPVSIMSKGWSPHTASPPQPFCCLPSEHGIHIPTMIYLQ